MRVLLILNRYSISFVNNPPKPQRDQTQRHCHSVTCCEPLFSQLLWHVTHTHLYSLLSYILLLFIPSLTHRVGFTLLCRISVRMSHRHEALALITRQATSSHATKQQLNTQRNQQHNSRPASLCCVPPLSALSGSFDLWEILVKHPYQYNIE